MMHFPPVNKQANPAYNNQLHGIALKQRLNGSEQTVAGRRQIKAAAKPCNYFCHGN